MSLDLPAKEATADVNWIGPRRLVTEFVEFAPLGERTRADVLRANAGYIDIVGEISGPMIAERLTTELVAEAERAQILFVPPTLRVPMARLRLPRV